MKLAKLIFTIAAIFLFGNADKTFAIQNNIVAKVGREIITKYDLDSQIKFLALIKNVEPEVIKSDKKAVQNILDSMVDGKLIKDRLVELRLKIAGEKYIAAKEKFLSNFNGAYPSIDEFVIKNNLNQEIVEEFIDNEVRVSKLLEHGAENVSLTKAERDTMTNNAVKRLREHCSKFTIIDFEITDQAKVTEINNLQLNKCDDIKEFLKKNSIKYDEREMQEKNLNPQLLAAISTKQSKIGLIQYQAQNNNPENKQAIKEGFIAFCGIVDPLLSNAKSKDDIIKEHKNEINAMLNQELVKKVLTETSTTMRENNHVKIYFK